MSEGKAPREPATACSTDPCPACANPVAYPGTHRVGSVRVLADGLPYRVTGHRVGAVRLASGETRSAADAVEPAYDVSHPPTPDPVTIAGRLEAEATGLEAQAHARRAEARRLRTARAHAIEPTLFTTALLVRAARERAMTNEKGDGRPPIVRGLGEPTEGG